MTLTEKQKAAAARRENRSEYTPWRTRDSTIQRGHWRGGVGRRVDLFHTFSFRRRDYRSTTSRIAGLHSDNDSVHIPTSCIDIIFITGARRRSNNWRIICTIWHTVTNVSATHFVGRAASSPLTGRWCLLSMQMRGRHVGYTHNGFSMLQRLSVAWQQMMRPARA